MTVRDDLIDRVAAALRVADSSPGTSYRALAIAAVDVLGAYVYSQLTTEGGV